MVAGAVINGLKKKENTRYSNIPDKRTKLMEVESRRDRLKKFNNISYIVNNPYKALSSVPGTHINGSINISCC